MDSQPQWPTQNDLPEKVRSGAIALLNQQLADALDPALQAKQAHASKTAKPRRTPKSSSARRRVCALRELRQGCCWLRDAGPRCG